MIASSDIELAKATPIESEIGRRGYQLKRQGPELVGPCPVCGGTDRFAVHTRKQCWQCRGCQKGGDVISLVQHLDGIEFPAAIEVLTGTAEKFRNQETRTVQSFAAGTIRHTTPVSYTSPKASGARPSHHCHRRQSALRRSRDRHQQSARPGRPAISSAIAHGITAQHPALLAGTRPRSAMSHAGSGDGQ